MKNTKSILSILCICVIAIGCQSSGGNGAGQAAFEKNSETVTAYLESWQNEDIDYDKFFAEDYSAWGTGYGDTDTANLEQMMQWDKQLLERYDFEIITDPINNLPGVDIETKKIDGSVRNYTEWALTLSATDSTPAVSGNIRMYQAFVFNEEGKMTLTLTYGDFTGLLNHLHGPPSTLVDDALDVDPDHYSVLMENDKVRVIRINYQVGDKSVMHSHRPGVVTTPTDGSESGIPWEIEWDAATQPHNPGNETDEPIDLIYVELKN